jgi:hypothetical protein
MPSRRIVVDELKKLIEAGMGDAAHDLMEDAIVDLYDYDFEGDESMSKYDLLEELFWADIGVEALHEMALDWIKHYRRQVVETWSTVVGSQMAGAELWKRFL